MEAILPNMLLFVLFCSLLSVKPALACSLAAGAEISEAIEFANFAAGVTVQKLYTTGTASGEEILKVCANPVYNQ